MKKYWEVSAYVADGTQINNRFCYCEGGNVPAERARQNALEAWLLGQHEDCICWSICIVKG